MRSATRRDRGALSKGAPLMFAFAAACVLIPGMFWWGTTFTRRLDDSVLAEQLGPEARPRDLQHAIEEISHRLEEGRPGMDRWADELVRISSNPETAVRVSAAWCMQFDAYRETFIVRLREMLTDDPSEMVRRNAATSLAKSGDVSARPVLRAMLLAFTITAPAEGRVASILAVDLPVQLGQLVARLELPAETVIDAVEARLVELRAPVPGTVSDVLVAEGEIVTAGHAVALLAPSLEHLRNGILGLALVGTSEDAPLLRQIGDPRSGYPDEIRGAARVAAERAAAR